MLTQSEVKELLEYDKETGELLWKVDMSTHTRSGDPIGYVDSQGYSRTRIEDKNYRLHRLIWLYEFGYFPEKDIDHVDQDKLNNKLENLREVSRQCNMRNTGNLSSNTSGVKGVSWDKEGNLWTVRISVNKKQIYLGGSPDFIEAVCHRLAAEQALDWEGCNSSSPAYKQVLKYLEDSK